jgi:hypothetical protein
MNKRNESEERVYQMLLDCGIPVSDILEPDKDNKSKRKEPDFVINGVSIAVEVKEFNDEKLKKEDLAQLEKVRSGESASWWVPVKNKQFERHLSDTAKKFRNYPDHSTMLVLDFSEMNYLVPDKEFLIGGLVTMYLERETGDLIKYSNTQRKLRVDQYTEFGAICFLEKSRVNIFHNLMCEKGRRLPYYFWAKQLEKMKFDQFVFCCPPSSLSIMYKLVDYNKI